jgi:CelD/BcsL family acetyltransferase involved in cellulose biosynthesis
MIAALREGLRESPGAAAVPSATAWAGFLIGVTSDLAAIEAEWRSFEKRADGTAFQSFDWLAKWQRHIGAAEGAVPAIVVGREAGGAPAFILPLAIEKAGIARRLTWLGAALCDYNGPLLAPGFSERIGTGFPALWRQIQRLLSAHAAFRFDFVDLPKMLDSVGAQRNPFLDLQVHANPSGAYVATLGGDWESWYAAKRSGPTRKKERKQLKQLGEHGTVRFFEPATRADIIASMETLIEQKARSFARLGVANAFDRPGHRAFYLDITTDPMAAELVHVSRLDVGETMASTSLGLRFHGSYSLVLSSYQDGALARFGPGRAHLNELIRTAIEAKFAYFDFTIGDEPYKRDYSDIVLHPHDHLAAATLLGRAVVSGMVGFRGLKRFIKQTPFLWHTYSRVRSWRGLFGRRGQRAADTTDAE